MDSPSVWIDVAKNISTVGFGPGMVVIVIAGWFQKWVYGWQFVAQKELTAEANKRGDFWQQLYLSRVAELEKRLERLETP
jgi:hypothetical protein